MSDLKQTYNQYAGDYAKSHNKILPYLEEIYNQLTSLIPEKSKILDLGCGTGRDAKYFSKKNYDVTGFDFSEEMIKIAKKTAPKAKFFVKDILKDDFEENIYNLVWANASLLHISKKDIDKVIIKIFKSLKMQGIFFVSLKIGEGEDLIPFTIDGEKILRFFVFYSEKKAQELLERNNFKILKTNINSSNEKQYINIIAQKI